MAVLPVQDIPVDGFAPTLANADSGGDEAPVGAGIFAYIVNGNAGAVTVTFDVPVTVNGAVTYAPSVAAGANLWLALRGRNPDPELHVDESVKRITTENATWTYSATGSVQVAVLRAR